MTIPKNVQTVLTKLKKSHTQVASDCISEVEKALKGSGFSDSQLWARTALHTIIGELGNIEDELGLEQMAMQLDGFEREAVEAFYEVFTDMQDELVDVKPADIRDTLVYSIMQTLDQQDKKNYKGLYG
jgi:hypothetical protein|tara:strand:- start:3254 stop:3637 length:384 start_codon:yes stop_codon:yes gene_type:complete